MLLRAILRKLRLLPPPPIWLPSMLFAEPRRGNPLFDGGTEAALISEITDSLSWPYPFALPSAPVAITVAVLPDGCNGGVALRLGGSLLPLPLPLRWSVAAHTEAMPPATQHSDQCDRQDRA